MSASSGSEKNTYESPEFRNLHVRSFLFPTSRWWPAIPSGTSAKRLAQQYLAPGTMERQKHAKGGYWAATPSMLARPKLPRNIKKREKEYSALTLQLLLLDLSNTASFAMVSKQLLLTTVRVVRHGDGLAHDHANKHECQATRYKIQHSEEIDCHQTFRR